MNKNAIIAVSAIVCIIAAVAYVSLKPSTSGPMPAQTTKLMTPNPAPANSVANSADTKAGSYEDYSKEAVAAETNTKILFFHAPWCPQCRKLENDIKTQGVPEGVTIFKVDYDNNQALRKKYGVTIQTSLVKVDDEGDLIKKYVAYDEPTLANVAANLLP